MQQPNATGHAQLPEDFPIGSVLQLLELSLDMICLANREGVISYINPAWEKNLGWKNEDMAGHSFMELVHPDDKEGALKAFHGLLEGNELDQFENRCIGKDGNYYSLLWALPALPPDSRFIYASARNLNAVKSADSLLRESEERYRIVVESSGQLIYDYDIATGTVIWQGAVEQITGYTLEEFSAMNIEMWAANVHPDDREQATSLLEEAIRTRSKYDFQYRFLHKHGHYIYIADTGVCQYTDDGTTRRMLGTMSDVTAVVGYERSLQEGEAKLRASLHDKEVLLREIHHRVKNNLQIISSLLNLQASHIDEKSRELFRESRDRIRSMALIHEQLYATDDLSQICVYDYLRQLTTNLWRSYDSRNVALELNIDRSILLDIDQAIPCGLIVNELVSNAMKYAFANSGAGTISIGFAVDGSQHTLTVADNGQGLPASINPATVRTLGLQLVDTLVDQIRGTLSIDRSRGTAFTIAFPTAARKEQNATE